MILYDLSLRISHPAATNTVQAQLTSFPPMALVRITADETGGGKQLKIVSLSQ